MQDVIRFAALNDAARILEIYAPYITETTISFEYDVPTLPEFTDRMAGIMAKYPYIVYERGGVVVGYAYASPYNARTAYDYTVDLSVYVDKAYCGQQIGEALYAAVLDVLQRQGFYSAWACITADNHNSVKFHERMGFTYAGLHPATGYKFGQWLGVHWYYKMLNAPQGKPAPIKPIADFAGAALLQPPYNKK